MSPPGQLVRARRVECAADSRVRAGTQCSAASCDAPRGAGGNPSGIYDSGLLRPLAPSLKCDASSCLNGGEQ